MLRAGLYALQGAVLRAAGPGPSSRFREVLQPHWAALAHGSCSTSNTVRSGWGGVAHLSSLASQAAPATNAVPTPTAPQREKGTLDFSNPSIFRSVPTSRLLLSLAVFRACGVPWFVDHAQQLLNLSLRVLGSSLTYKLVKHTFFAQFCAGETEAEVLETTQALSRYGIGSILDYAAEDDVSSEQTPARPNTAIPPPAAAPPPSPSPAPASTDELHVATDLAPAAAVAVSDSFGAVARQYSYANEQQCDAHVRIFLAAIDSASRMPGQGFAAVKLTALGNPQLLERVSTAIRHVQALFGRFDADGSGTIDVTEFVAAYKALFPDATKEEKARVFAWLDTLQHGSVDYVSWCQRLSLSRMPEYAARIPNIHPTGVLWPSELRAAALTREEVELFAAMRRRLDKLAAAAAAVNVKLMVDAEHTYFQPAIDYLTVRMMKRYNAAGTPGAPCTIYNTYQAYLTDAHQRLAVDLERSRREGYVLGVKLVRGAYLELERTRAASMGYPSPVWGTLPETHANYNRCMEDLLACVKDGRAEVLLGTHNQDSVERAVALMAEHGLTPTKTPVYFGQLLGMSDHLTFTLGSSGYQAFKYVPYGRVEQVVPYLLRRAAENRDIFKGARVDVQLLQDEVTRRMRRAVGLKTA